VESLAISEGEDLVTLVTCTPYGVNTHRLLVRGHRIAYVEEEYIAVQQQEVKTDTVQMRMQALCVLIGLALAGVIVFLINHFGRGKAKPDEKTGGRRRKTQGEKKGKKRRKRQKKKQKKKLEQENEEFIEI